MKRTGVLGGGWDNGVTGYAGHRAATSLRQVFKSAAFDTTDQSIVKSEDHPRDYLDHPPVLQFLGSVWTLAPGLPHAGLPPPRDGAAPPEGRDVNRPGAGCPVVRRSRKSSACWETVSLPNSVLMKRIMAAHMAVRKSVSADSGVDLAFMVSIRFFSKRGGGEEGGAGRLKTKWERSHISRHP